MEYGKNYKKEDVLKKSIEYFKGDSMAADVWINKYALKDSNGNIYEQSPDDMHKRLASEFARIEKKYKNPMSEDEIYNLIKDFKYIVPQGGSMAGVGNDFQYVSLSNCFVVGNDKDSDSYGGILKLDQDMVQLQKRRGGVGIDVSFIRPEGSPVLNSALTSTGIVPFMERFSNSTKEVAQDGRRGALMLSISIKHPDAEKFIDAKMKDGCVTGANISVKLTDEFMRCVEEKKPFIQQYPVDSDSPKIKKEIDAYALWKKIIHNAWKHAEPGVLFWDTLINESIPDCYSDKGFKTVSTNPCLTSDSWILTKDGPRRIDALINKKFKANVDGSFFNSTENGFFKSDNNRDVYQIKTKSGLKLKSTENHKYKQFVDGNFVWSELQNLKVGNKVKINYNKKNTWKGKGKFQEGWILGCLMSNGNIDSDKCTLIYKNNDSFNIAISFILALKGICSDVKSEEVDGKYYISDEYLKKLVKKYNVKINKNINDKIQKEGSVFYEGFISGVFDSICSINDDMEDIEISLSNIDMEIIQMMLLRLGIFSCINGNILKITGNNLGEFLDRVGFLNISKYKNAINIYLKNDLKNDVNYFVDDIVEISYVGKYDVFDCQIEGINEYDANGFNVHNCGEIPLCPLDSCRLISLNLYSYVINPFTNNASFDIDKFKEHTIKAQRLMDGLIDLELEKIEKILNKINEDPEENVIKRAEVELWEGIKNKAILGRRTGLGITAEGDMLAAMGLIYGSDNAIKFSENIHKTLKLEAYRSSVILSKERGCFEIWDKEKEKNSVFLKRIEQEDKDLYDEMRIYGRRNIALLTIAPTGSVSIMTQTTSGIEPTFMSSYTRRRKINPQEKDVKVDYTDSTGEKWQEYHVFHHKFERWLEINGYNKDDVKKLSEDDINKIIEKSPYHKSTIKDVDWVKKVEMQGIIQKHVDHSISVTVNLPNDATEDIVESVYKMAWKSGCKGLTVYREGSRSGILISSSEDNKTNKEENDSEAIKRPKVIDSDVVTFQNNYEKWIAVIGKVGTNGRPYELFTGKLDSFQIPNYVKSGKITKRKTENGSIYDFSYIDKDGFLVKMEGLSRSFNEQFWNYAKLISGLLRHRMPMLSVVSVVEGLKLEGDSLNTWKNGVVRVLKKYIEDGTESHDTCPKCGSKLVYVEGCLKCNSCGGFSKCG